MGIFSDIKAINDIQKIKNGETKNLSISQITGLITNMSDAKNNLTPKEFEEVYNLFKEFRKCNTKMPLNIGGYYKTAKYIIKKFDAIAPYEKYSGGNELEMAFLMEEIQDSIDNKTKNINDLPKEDIEYIKNILEKSNGIIEENDAIDLMDILHTQLFFGKNKALDEFDALVLKIIERSTPIKSISKISFLAGVLNANNIISEQEMKNLLDKYQELIMNLLKK